MEKDQEERKDNIYFYRKDAQYGFLSNFYPSPFQQNDLEYTTNQHYFQSKKFQGNKYEKIIVQAKTPAEAFKLGRSRQIPIRDDWEDQKQRIMYQGLKLKFTQNENLKEQLLATLNRKIVQHTARDSYWADGKNGKGQNRLGMLLMKLRKQLSDQKK